MGGVTVGLGSVIGAGSVVVKDVCPFVVVVGNPCNPVRRIFSDQVLRSHLVEIGYADNFATEVMKRRSVCLNGIAVPVLDKTEIYPEVIYEKL